MKCQNFAFQNESLHNVYASPKIVRVIISRRMRWAEDIACMGVMRNAYSILVGKPEGKKETIRKI
jgi:hypothetical protein